jgi:hypothetical protein
MTIPWTFTSKGEKVLRRGGLGEAFDIGNTRWAYRR